MKNYSELSDADLDRLSKTVKDPEYVFMELKIGVEVVHLKKFPSQQRLVVSQGMSDIRMSLSQAKDFINTLQGFLK